MESKDIYRAKIDAQLKEWAVKIADLKGKAELAEASMKVEYLKQIEALRLKKEEAETKLEDLKNAGDDAWDVLKSGMDKAVSELKNALNTAVSKFK
ncbi:coiled coil domain-containing protein [bacterium]|nr:coiled coil domain-containing protein [bacterium]